MAVELDDYLDISQTMLLTLTTGGRVSHINRTGCEILGRPESDIIGLNWFDTFLPASVRSEMRDLLTRTMTGEVDMGHVESPVISRTRGERLIAWHDAPIRLADGRVVGMILSGLDVTDRQQTKAHCQQLVRELSETKHALDQSAIVATTDVRGAITYANDKFCEISKYPREELLGQDHRLINSGYHPKAFFRDLWTTIGAGEIWRGEIKNRAKDGSLYWVDTTIVPFLDAHRRPYQYMAIRYETTGRKAAETRLRDQETLTRLGEMAAVVAHEVRNPLAGISGALQIIGSRLPADGSDRAIVGDIQNRVDALNELVRDLLVFARPKTPALAPTPLAALLAQTVAALRRDPAFADVVVVVTGDTPTVPADREQLRMVFHNLLVNAAQAIDGHGTVTVDVQDRGDRYRVRIADDGAGLTPEALDNMFEPFFTTKHQGSGLGLPTARRIVEAHGGELAACPRPEGGTVVTISLPRHRGESPG